MSSQFKSRIARHRLNFEMPTFATILYESSDASQDGYHASDLSHDYSKWISKNTKQLTIKTEISGTDLIDTISVLNTNLSAQSQVHVAGFDSKAQISPNFSVQLIRKGNNWIYFTTTPLPSSQYFTFTIVDPTPKTSFFEIGKVILSISEELPFQVVDGWADEKESFQKRELQNGQWLSGSNDEKLDSYSFQLRPAQSMRNRSENDYPDIQLTIDLFNDLKTSNPFIFILDPLEPEDIFGYFVLDPSTLNFSTSNGELLDLTFKIKETR